MKKGEQLEAAALRLLRSVPGVEAVDTTTAISADRTVDGVVRFAGRRARVTFDVRSRVNAAVARQLADDAMHHPGGTKHHVVIAGETTADARAILAAKGIGLVDGLGNAHVELPGMLLHLEHSGREPITPSRPDTPKLTGKAGVVAQALLADPERAWQVAEVAEVAEVSPGLAHRVLVRLQAAELVVTEGAGPQRIRRVANASALLDLWAEETATERPQRTLAHVVARTPRLRMQHLAADLERAEVPYAITGSAAAAELAPLLTALPTTEIWVPTRFLVDDLLATVRAEPVTQGANLVFLQIKGDAPLAFARRAGDVVHANVFRIYADLRRDPRRGTEQADNLRREVIGL